MNTLPIDHPADNVASAPLGKEYEAPAIEAVLTPEEMSREVLYAGLISGPIRL